MPYALLLIGAVMLVAGVRNTYKDLWALVENDFTGQGGFLSWVAAIAVIGGLGYIPKLKPLSVALMTLLLLVLVLSNKGVFAKLAQFIAMPQVTGSGVATAASTLTTQSPTTQPLSSIDIINQNLQGINGQ